MLQPLCRKRFVNVMVHFFVGVIMFSAGVALYPVIKFFKNRIEFFVDPDKSVHPDYNFNERRISHFKELGKNQSIVFLGDSRIDDVEWCELLGRSDVSNRGIAGDTVTGVALRLSSSMPSPTKVCVVQVGFNDILQGDVPEHVFQNYKQLLLELARNTEQIVLVSIIPAGSSYAYINTAVASLNEMLADYAETKGIIWLDMNKIIAPSGLLSVNYTDDDIHLNGLAVRALGGALADLLGEIEP